MIYGLVIYVRTWTWCTTCYLFAEIFDCILLEVESDAFSRSLFNRQFMFFKFLVTKYLQSLCFQMIEELPNGNAFFQLKGNHKND